MRLIKLAVVSFVVLFIIVTAISLLIPSHLRISRASNMLADKDSIFKQLSNPQAWKEWYPGLENKELVYQSGKPIGIVANDNTKATILIDTIIKDEVITLMSSNRTPITSGWKVLKTPSSDSTIVQWYMDMQLSWYPWDKFSSLLFERSFGPRMEQGLERLKARVQKKED